MHLRSCFRNTSHAVVSQISELDRTNLPPRQRLPTPTPTPISNARELSVTHVGTTLNGLPITPFSGFWPGWTAPLVRTCGLQPVRRLWSCAFILFHGRSRVPCTCVAPTCLTTFNARAMRGPACHHTSRVSTIDMCHTRSLCPAPRLFQTPIPQIMRFLTVCRTIKIWSTTGIASTELTNRWGGVGTRSTVMLGIQRVCTGRPSPLCVGPTWKKLPIPRVGSR